MRVEVSLIVHLRLITLGGGLHFLIRTLNVLVKLGGAESAHLEIDSAKFNNVLNPERIRLCLSVELLQGLIRRFRLPHYKPHRLAHVDIVLLLLFLLGSVIFVINQP